MMNAEVSGGESVRRMPSLVRNHSAMSQDPYRSDVVDSSLYSDSGRRFSDAESFRLDERGQPRVGLPWRTALVALFLFGFGLTFLLLGVLHFRDKDTGLMIAFATLGSIAFLPGAYATYNLYHAYRGTPGFHLSQIAHFDDFRW